MSSSMSDIECPVCGQGAIREQDTDTLEIYDSCSVCGWETGDDYVITEKLTIVWSWKDIQIIKPDWSQERCQKALCLIGNRLKERSVELGWDVITILLDEYKSQIEDKGDEDE